MVPTETIWNHADLQGASRFRYEGDPTLRINPELIRRAKIQGFSDFQIARAIGLDGDVEKGMMLVRPVP